MIAISILALCFIVVAMIYLTAQDRANRKTGSGLSVDAMMHVVQLRAMARDGNLEAIAGLEELDTNLKAQGQKGIIEEGEKKIFEKNKL